MPSAKENNLIFFRVPATTTAEPFPPIVATSYTEILESLIHYSLRIGDPVPGFEELYTKGAKKSVTKNQLVQFTSALLKLPPRKVTLLTYDEMTPAQRSVLRYGQLMRELEEFKTRRGPDFRQAKKDGLSIAMLTELGGVAWNTTKAILKEDLRHEPN